MKCFFSLSTCQHLHRGESDTLDIIMYQHAIALTGSLPAQIYLSEM